jgi:hypothetical protein
MGYAQLEPFGGPIEDIRAGIGAASTLNVNRSKDSKPVSPLDFFSWHKPPPEPPVVESPEVLAARLKAFFNRKASPSNGQ